MRFYHILHKNSIIYILIEDLPGLFSPPPLPQGLEKKRTFN